LLSRTAAAENGQPPPDFLKVSSLVAKIHDRISAGMCDYAKKRSDDERR